MKDKPNIDNSTNYLLYVEDTFWKEEKYFVKADLFSGKLQQNGIYFPE